MEWIGTVEGIVTLVAYLGACLCFLAFWRKRWDLQNALNGLLEIQGLVNNVKSAMADGHLSDQERDEIIDRIGKIAKKFI